MTRIVGALIIAAIALPAPSRAEIIDRILAVVDGAIIMQSDVMMTVRLGLVAGATAASDQIAAPLEALIERRLIFPKSDRHPPPGPAGAENDRPSSDRRGAAGAPLAA